MKFSKGDRVTFKVNDTVYKGRVIGYYNTTWLYIDSPHYRGHNGGNKTLDEGCCGGIQLRHVTQTYINNVKNDIKQTGCDLTQHLNRGVVLAPEAHIMQGCHQCSR